MLYLRQGHAFVELVQLVFVGVLVDRSLVDEGLDELLFATLQLRDLALGGGSLGGDVFSPGLPDVQDDGPEEGQELGAGTEAIEEGQELGFQLVAWGIRLAATGFRWAVIVGVALALALRPGAGEGLAAVAAGREATEGEVRVVALLRHDQAIGAEEALATPEGVFVHECGPVAGGVNVPGGLDDPADVESVGEHLSPFLGGQLAALQGAEASVGEVFEDLHAGVEARCEALEAEPYERGALGVQPHALAVWNVTQGRLPDPLAPAQSFLHAGSRPSASDLVVELRKGGEDAFHELAGRGLVDRLADRPEGDAEAGQVPADDRVVECVAGEPIDVGDDEDVDPDGALVLLAQVGQGGLELGAVGGLGGLAALQKDPVDFPSVQAAEGSALVFLDGEGEVVGLLFAADAAVDDRSE
ncbi:MAG TPA: hypothetical protein VF756_05955 [Thermoanaerobaculia bacterium]